MNKHRKHPSPQPGRPEESTTRKSIELKITNSRSAVSLRNARKSPSNIFEAGGSGPGGSSDASLRSHAGGVNRPHRKEIKATQGAGVFDELLSLPHDEKCDAEIQSINTPISEVILHNPAGQKSLQGLVAQQQREQQGGRALDAVVPIEETCSESSTETSTMSYMSGGCGSPSQGTGSLLSAALAAAEAIDTHKAHTLSLEDLTHVYEKFAHQLNIVANELVRRTGSVPIGGTSLPTPPPQTSQAKSPKSTGSLSSLYGSSGGHVKGARQAVVPPFSVSAVASRFKNNGSLNPIPIRSLVRRNSKDRNVDSLRRSVPDEELPFPLHDEDDDHHLSSMRHGAIPPSSKMFDSSRDFVMGTSPTTRPLPNFGDFGKPTRIQGPLQRPVQIKSVKIEDEIKKYFGDGRDPPMFATLTETLSFINLTQQRNAKLLNVSPRTAFDDRSLGSQSTASTSSGRAQTSKKTAVDDVEKRAPASSALSRSLHASSISSMGSLSSMNSAEKTVVANDPPSALVDLSATDFISIAVVDALDNSVKVETDTKETVVGDSGQLSAESGVVREEGGGIGNERTIVSS